MVHWKISSIVPTTSNADCNVGINYIIHVHWYGDILILVHSFSSDNYKLRGSVLEQTERLKEHAQRLQESFYPSSGYVAFILARLL